MPQRTICYLLPVSALFVLLVFAPAFLHAQTKLPGAFSFKKEAGNFGFFYHIEPAEPKGDGKALKPFQTLAASVMPGLKSGGLIFINAQPERTISTQTVKTASIIYDSKQLKDLEFEYIGEDEPENSVIKTEAAALAIELKDLLEILKARSVTARFGSVSYRLDKDNIAAFHYLAEQIEKDLKPIPKRQARAKAVRKKPARHK